MGETEILAKYIVNSKYRDLPKEVIEKTKERIGDIIACGLGGRKTLEGDTLIAVMKSLGGKPQATVIGDKTRLSFMQAAQVNRVLTNMLDYDDDYTNICHMSTALVPVALAIGEWINASGKDIIHAFVLGCEVVTRLRAAVNPSVDVFWKTFERIDTGLHLGVTAVAGKMLGLNSDQMASAFGLTGRMPPWRDTRPDWAKKGMPAWKKITGGDITIPGIHAVLLARTGFPGDHTILDQGKGYETSVGSDRYDGKKLITNWGKEYGITKIGYKFYSACRYTSTTLDAVATIMAKNHVKPDDVQEIIVKVQKLVSDNFAIYEPTHMIQAQFSMPYVVTMVMMGEPTGPNWFRKDLLKNPKIRKFQHKVKLVEDPIATKKFYPEYKTPSTVEIIMKNGKRFIEHVEYPKGEPENPFSKQDHINKFNNMASSLGMGQRKINRLIGTLYGLDKVETCSELTRLLVP